MAINASDVDDAIMQGDAQSDEWIAEIEKAYAAPVKAAQAAGVWNSILAQTLPGVPASMVEAELRKIDPKAYDAAKKKFMEGMKNGPKR